MATATKQEWPPLLNVGFHPMGMEQLRRLCVDRFPDSITRLSIMNKLEKILQLISQQAIPSAVWVDGSFLTEKLNPDDVDVLWVINSTDFVAMSAAQRIFFQLV